MLGKIGTDWLQTKNGCLDNYCSFSSSATIGVGLMKIKDRPAEKTMGEKRHVVKSAASENRKRQSAFADTARREHHNKIESKVRFNIVDGGMREVSKSSTVHLKSPTFYRIVPFPSTW